MDIAYMAGEIAFVIYLITLIALPLTALFDMTAFIVYLTQLKSDNAKRRGAEKVFIIASVCLTVNIVLTALSYLVIYIFG